MKKSMIFLLVLFKITTTIGQESIVTKQVAIDSIKAYYSKFETGSEYYENPFQFTKKPGYTQYRKITGNYIFLYDNCNIKLSWDIYNWPFEEIIRTESIEFNLSVIDSLRMGPSYTKPFIPLETQEQGLEEYSNGSIAFYTIKNKTIIKGIDKKEVNNILDFEEYLPIEYEGNEDEAKEYFFKMDIVKYFTFLLNDCKN